MWTIIVAESGRFSNGESLGIQHREQTRLFSGIWIMSRGGEINGQQRGRIYKKSRSDKSTEAFQQKSWDAKQPVAPFSSASIRAGWFAGYL
jgi:hypothetical protein